MEGFFISLNTKSFALDITQLHQIFLKSSGICTDTRKIEKDCLFVALKGENFDGNLFAQEALKKGAIAALIDDKKQHRPEKGTLLCEDSLNTLQELANFHRNYLGLPILALTGSNGKTTTKELIHAVLSQKFNCTATRGNLNNHIGVPLTLLSMNANTEFGIVEMGANHQKEIEALCKIAEPDYGLITNFGKAHLEGFGGVEGVVKGKSELYHHLREQGGTVFVNAQHQRQVEITEGMKRILFLSEGDEFPITKIPSDDFIEVNYQGMTIKTKLIGEYNFDNIASAIVIGAHFGVSIPKIKSALEAYEPKMNRSEIRQQNGHQIIMDAYNANPSSMMAALNTFEKTKGFPKVVILGDMFELGPSAQEEHQAVVNYLELHHDYVAILVGENFYRTRTNAPHIHKAAHFKEAPELIQNLVPPSSTLLVKGSRGMALERCLEYL